MKIVENKLQDRPVYQNGRYVKPRIYFFVKNETLLENMEVRRSRPYNEYRKLLNEAFTIHGIDSNNIKVNWSQKAGCSCGCSPGFICQGFDEKLYGKDMFVTVS